MQAIKGLDGGGYWAARSNMTNRDTIWNNTDTKLHGVFSTSSEDNAQYLTWFLVYYDKFGWTEGVFWLDGQCCLELKCFEIISNPFGLSLW